MPHARLYLPLVHLVKKFLPLALLSFATASVVAQVPCSTNNLGTNLGLTDETVSGPQALGFTFVYNGIGYTDIQVCDNGYVTLGASGGAAEWNVLSGTMLADTFPRICPLWVDLEPGVTGSGDVFFSTVAASGATPAYAVITWNAVFDYAGSTPHTFQLFLIDGGQIRFTYDNNLTAIPAFNPWLVGATPGNNAAANPVSFASLPITTSGNATLHEENVGPLPLANRTFDWVPDGIGGYIVLENTTCASAVSYGTGCVASYASAYEHFTTTPSIDLSNTSFTMIFTGNAYTVVPSSTAFMAPSVTATNLALTDDSETTVTLSSALSYPGGSTTQLNVCSNGHISTATNSAAFDYTPTPDEFLNWPNATWAVWRDMIPNASGNVWFEEVNGIVYITWLNVVGYVGLNAGTTPSTFQLQFNLGTGSVDFVFQSLDTVSVSGWTGGEGWIVGFSPAGASVDPGSTDLSTGLPVVLQASDNAPLALSASTAPVAGTTINLVTSNIPAGTSFGAVTLGFAQFNPGISLAGIGMPGCFQYTDNLVTLLFFPGANTSVPTVFNVPNAPGLTIQCQGLVFAPNAAVTTPLGALSSNGLALQIN